MLFSASKYRQSPPASSIAKLDKTPIIADSYLSIGLSLGTTTRYLAFIGWLDAIQCLKGENIVQIEGRLYASSPMMLTLYRLPVTVRFEFDFTSFKLERDDGQNY